MNTTHVAGATSKIITLYARVISTGLPYTAGVYNTSGISASYKRDGAAATALTLVTATAGTYTSSGFVHAGKGAYEIGAPTLSLATGVDGVEFMVDGISDVAFIPVRVELVGVDPRSTAAVSADVTKWSGTNVASPATAGHPVVTLKTTEVTTVANATVEAEITALLTYNRSANATGTITGPTSGSNALGLSTDATYLPIKTL